MKSPGNNSLGWGLCRFICQPRPSWERLSLRAPEKGLGEWAGVAGCGWFSHPHRAQSRWFHILQ